MLVVEKIKSFPLLIIQKGMGFNSMITNQTQAYASLFEKASLALGLEKEEDKITNLNEYFNNIEELSALDLKYTILPLDEETFDINANTRTITIPPSFKNGVGVKGDQVAEIIYFTIDRYFDATDLDTQNIYIEWQNANGDKGLSKEYVRDLITQPGKIIFGWPLTSQITEQHGVVDFAVRFYTIKETQEGSQIVYSFSTLPAKITINKSLDFDLVNEDQYQILGDQVIDMIKDRFQNSELTDSDVEAIPPTFLLDLEAGDIIDLDRETGEITLRAQAYGSGNITYFLQKESKVAADGWETLDYEEPVYELTKDKTRQENNIYYIENVDESGRVNGYQVFDGEIPQPNTTVYEKFGDYTVDSVGSYRFKVQNRDGKAKAWTFGNAVTVPEPVVPEINTGIFNKFLENNEGVYSVTLSMVPLEDNLDPAQGGELSYQWSTSKGNIPGAVESSFIATDEDTYLLYVTNTRNKVSKVSDPATYRVTFHATSPVILTETTADFLEIIKQPSLKITLNESAFKFDKVYVQWFEKINPNGDKDLENDEARSEMVEVIRGQEISYTPTETGKFYAKLIAEYNTEYSEPTFSKEWTVV